MAPSFFPSPTLPTVASSQLSLLEPAGHPSNRSSSASTLAQRQAEVATTNQPHQEVGESSTTPTKYPPRRRIYDTEQQRKFILKQLQEVNAEIAEVEKVIQDEENGRGLGQEGAIEQLQELHDHKKGVSRFLQEKWVELGSELEDLMADLGFTEAGQDFDESWLEQTLPEGPRDDEQTAASGRGRGRGQDQGAARGTSPGAGRGQWRGHWRGPWRGGNFRGQARGQWRSRG